MVRLLKTALLISMLAATAAAQDEKISFQVVPLAPTLGLPDSHETYVIRSPEEWSNWVNNLTAVVDVLPAVDFERYTSLIASAGYKADGPVVVTFDSIADAGNLIRVHVSVTTPASCPARPIAGHYAAMALIPRTDKPVQFDVSSRDTGCH
ncbi:MAG TPA: hypothetical protein VME42_05420 [Steroidobacteraceae bacterium]|nr:hypothetical protein [Steroidobacteraceae bacterium]